MESSVTSTSLLEQAELAFSPRSPGLVDSEEEENHAEDMKRDMMHTHTTLPTSYPSMLRLLQPHLYRHYHPYLHYTNTMLGYHYQGHN